MAALDKEKKSSRLLASRRYTHETLNASQESFTEVLDLGATEIYTETDLIPSSGLPYSGSTQIHSTYSTEGKSVMKYWYRQRLTKSNTNNEVWFFLDPTGSDSGIGAQLISDDQTVNFISPKYSIAGLATSTTEDSTPGYLATLLKSTSLDSSSLDGDDIVSTNDYTFDYKTGVVQFTNSSVDPGNSDYLYMTVYQYVGSTLASGNISGSSTSTGSFGRLEVGELSITDDLTYGSTNWNESGGALSVTGSDFFWKSTGGGFDIYDNSDALMFKIENKVAVLGARTTTPTAQAGGIFYSGSDDFFFGYENEVS